MSDERDERGQYGEDAEDAEDDAGSEWPVKGPATPQQAILAIGFVFFIGVVVGFLLCRTF
jgi:hypothetical protein